MAKKLKYYSVFTEDMEHCIECGRQPVQYHHVFGGYAGNRDHATEDGLVIPLCLDHHINIHNDPNKRLERKWRTLAQAIFEETHTREEFRARYGRSYL